jgi:hypothetical protein
MACNSLWFFVLGLPLLIVYALQKKEKKNKLWLTLGLIFMLFFIFFLCTGFITGNIGKASTTTPIVNNATSVSIPLIIQTEPSTDIPTTIPTSTTLPLATDTPDMYSCSIIESVRNNYLDKLTWEQYHLEGGEVDIYIKSLYGKGINFRGVVDDVIGDNVFIHDESCNNNLSLSGIPGNESILLNKGSIISGYGTVGVFSTYEIIHLDVESYQVGK